MHSKYTSAAAVAAEAVICLGGFGVQLHWFGLAAIPYLVHA